MIPHFSALFCYELLNDREPERDIKSSSERALENGTENETRK